MNVTMQDGASHWASLWGQAFELAVKRGALGLLLHRKLLAPDHPALSPWTGTWFSALDAAMIRELEILDDNLIEQTRQALSHLLVQGYGLGWTSLRQWLANLVLKNDSLELQALWCPLGLPHREANRDQEAAETIPAFTQAFNLGPSPLVRSLTAKGHPAWSDFTLWLRTLERPLETPKDYLLVQEFSYSAPQVLPDYTRTDGHLVELTRYAALMDRRGVFSRISAEVSGDRFLLSSTLKSHLAAFATRDKPLYKLCQGASYMETTLDLLREQGKLSNRVRTRVMAVTTVGVETLAADWTPQDHDPRMELLRGMGAAYRAKVGVQGDGPEQSRKRLDDEMRMVVNKMLQGLPPDLRKQFKEINFQPTPGCEMACSLREEVQNFTRPTTVIDLAEAGKLIGDHPSVDAFFRSRGRGDASQAVLEDFTPLIPKQYNTLRGLHAAAVIAGFKAARPGELNVLALEGNPGIGKTTAVRTHLTETADEGFFFLYLSPRVVINRDVTTSFARSGQDILTLTTNARLNHNAQSAHAAATGSQPGKPPYIDSALVVDGIGEPSLPTMSNIWFVRPDDEQVLERSSGAYRFVKRILDQRTDLIRERKVPGVLATLATGSRQLLEANPDVSRLVLTAALQSYRIIGNNTTITSLSNMFTNKNPDMRAGLAERRAFMQRFPRIVVMLDEVGGDGTGAPFVHTIAKWLDDQFINPFGDNPPPCCTVSLVIADASLGNEKIMENYLTAPGPGDAAPEKILITPSSGEAAFQLAVTRFRVGPIKPEVLHVMTNSFPAETLHVRYAWKLHRLQPMERPDGAPMSNRELIRKQAGEKLLHSAASEVLASVRSGTEQTIFFAQDKNFLSSLKDALCSPAPGRETEPPPLSADQVAIIDSSVTASEREALVAEPLRDTKKVFLMTSSGARGVSFPLTTRIIAAIPRFNIETGLMEVAQLIYRGRGSRTDPATNQKINCDDLPRELVMLIDDFVVDDELREDPRYWLRRASDLLTLVLMLRGAILTRITGDAGLHGKRLALVPVGHVGAAELLTSMSQTVQDFLREANAFAIRQSRNREVSSLARAAVESAENLFRGHCLSGQKPKKDQPSFTDLDQIRAFVRAAGFSSGTLFSKEPEQVPVLPENIHCIGPFWLEDWSGMVRDLRESQNYDTFASNFTKLEKTFLGQLRSLEKLQTLPANLRFALKDIFRIFIRENQEVQLAYTSIKPLQTRHLWLALPLDYPKLCRMTEDGAERRKPLECEEDWHSLLRRVMPNSLHTAPVLPSYDDYPFAASIGSPDPARLAMSFDDRYFLASTELNLLNMVLLGDGGE